ncbi:MAG: hypothetical protein ACOCQD_01050 [archaeon]
MKHSELREILRDAKDTNSSIYPMLKYITNRLVNEGFENDIESNNNYEDLAKSVKGLHYTDDKVRNTLCVRDWDDGFLPVVDNSGYITGKVIKIDEEEENIYFNINDEAAILISRLSKKTLLEIIYSLSPDCRLTSINENGEITL